MYVYVGSNYNCPFGNCVHFHGAHGLSFAGHDRHPSWGLVMAGGWSKAPGDNDDGGMVSNMAFATRDGKNFEQLGPLPLEMSSNCLAVIDSDRLFVAGGHNSYRAAYVYSRKTGYKLKL